MTAETLTFVDEDTGEEKTYDLRTDQGRLQAYELMGSAGLVAKRTRSRTPRVAAAMKRKAKNRMKRKARRR